MATQRILPGRRILRYTLNERVMHWIAAFSFMYLLLTGLAFYTPHLYWLAQLLGGGESARYWHPVVGVMFSATVMWMFIEWRHDMRTTPEDRAWKRTFHQYISNRDEQVAGAARFNYGQKQFFWVMFWGGSALLLSGIGLWFTDLIPWSIHWLRYVAILVHVIAALFTIGAFIIHIYMGTAVVRQGFSSVIRGEVSEQWLQTHHPLWLRQINETKK